MGVGRGRGKGKYVGVGVVEQVPFGQVICAGRGRDMGLVVLVVLSAGVDIVLRGDAGATRDVWGCLRAHSAKGCSGLAWPAERGTLGQRVTWAAGVGLRQLCVREVRGVERPLVRILLLLVTRGCPTLMARVVGAACSLARIVLVVHRNYSFRNI